MNLVTSIDHIATAAPVPVTLKFELLQPFVDDAHNIFIMPMFPTPMMNSLFYRLNTDDDPTLTEEIPSKDETPLVTREILDELNWWKLIHLVIKAESLYALYLSVDELSVNLSGTGVTVIQSDTHRPAPQYQVMNVKERYIARAHEQMDLCLALIQNNFDTFNERAGDFYDSKLLVKDAKQFQVYADIHASRRVFLAMMPLMRNIEQRYLMPTLSRELYELLYTQIASSATLTDENKELMDYILPAVVHLTMARALVEINIDMLDWGIFNLADNTFKNVQNKTLLQQNRLGEMQAAYQRDGDADMKALQEFLDNNASATKYAAYFGSSRYVGPATAVTRAEFINTSDKSIFVA